MSDTAPVNLSEFAALRARVNAIENNLRGYLVRHRESMLRDVGEIEGQLGFRRTKPRPDVLSDVEEQIEYLEGRRAEILKGWSARRKSARATGPPATEGIEIPEIVIYWSAWHARGIFTR